MSGIYKIYCLLSSRIYVGSSIDIEKRIFEHFQTLRLKEHHSSILQKSYNKHGAENFKWEILEECEKENLIEREQYYLDLLFFAQEYIHNNDKRFSELSYNICPSARNSFGVKRSEEFKQKVSNSKKGTTIKKYIKSKEHCEKISQTLKERAKTHDNVNKNKVVSKELRKRISDTLKEKYKNGSLINSFKGKTHTEEAKEINRQKAIERRKNNKK